MLRKFIICGILWWTAFYGCQWQLINLSYYNEFKLKKDTLCAHSSNGTEICLAFFLHGKSYLCIAKGKEDICKPSPVNYWGTFMSVSR